MAEEIIRNRDLLSWATEMQAIAQTGLAYAKDRFDLQRYHQLMDIAAEMMVAKSGVSQSPVQSAFLQQKGYASPKVDVRAFILNENKLLLVQERQDGKWSLPGGWADVNHTPSESILKEIHEETGLTARINYIMAMWDTALHDHPPHWPYIYKCVFSCQITGGEWKENNEILAMDYFEMDKLPPLSTYRITKSQLATLYRKQQQADMQTLFD